MPISAMRQGVDIPPVAEDQGVLDNIVQFFLLNGRPLQCLGKRDRGTPCAADAIARITPHNPMTITRLKPLLHSFIAAPCI